MRRIVVALALVVVALPAMAAGIAVLTNAQPSLSQTGRPIWLCTYVVENRETVVVRDGACPPSIGVP